MLTLGGRKIDISAKEPVYMPEIKGPAATVTSLSEKLSAERQKLYDNVYAQHHKALLAFIRRMPLTTDEANDMVHDVFFRILRQNEPEKLKQAPRAYLNQIAVNLMRDKLRKDYRAKNVSLTDISDDEIVSPVKRPEVEAKRLECMELLKQAVKALQPNQRRVFLLHRFHHLSCKEISQDLGIPLRSVERYLAQAVAFCQEKIGGAYEK